MRSAFSLALRWPAAISGSARVSPTLRAGLSEPYGSWNTTWISRPSARRRARLAWVMSSPSKTMRPALAGVWPSTTLPMVVLPEPDSPTRPTVSPRPMCRLTPLSAWNTLPRPCG